VTLLACSPALPTAITIRESSPATGCRTRRRQRGGQVKLIDALSKTGAHGSRRCRSSTGRIPQMADADEVGSDSAATPTCVTSRAGAEPFGRRAGGRGRLHRIEVSFPASNTHNRKNSTGDDDFAGRGR